MIAASISNKSLHHVVSLQLTPCYSLPLEMSRGLLSGEDSRYMTPFFEFSIVRQFWFFIIAVISLAHYFPLLLKDMATTSYRYGQAN